MAAKIIQPVTIEIVRIQVSYSYPLLGGKMCVKQTLYTSVSWLFQTFDVNTFAALVFTMVPSRL